MEQLKKEQGEVLRMRGETMCKEVVDSTRASLEKAGDFILKKTQVTAAGTVFVATVTKVGCNLRYKRGYRRSKLWLHPGYSLNRAPAVGIQHLEGAARAQISSRILARTKRIPRMGLCCGWMGRIMKNCPLLHLPCTSVNGSRRDCIRSPAYYYRPPIV